MKKISVFMVLLLVLMPVASADPFTDWFRSLLDGKPVITGKAIVFDQPGIQRVTVGESLTFRLHAQDSGSSTLTYSGGTLAGPINIYQRDYQRYGVNFNGNTGDFSWNVAEDIPSGTYYIRFLATNSENIKSGIIVAIDVIAQLKTVNVNGHPLDACLSGIWWCNEGETADVYCRIENGEGFSALSYKTATGARDIFQGTWKYSKDANQQGDGSYCSQCNRYFESIECSQPQSGTQITTPVITYSCTGSIPEDSHICAGDDQGLTANTARNLVSSCGDAKCEYVCNDEYVNVRNRNCLSSAPQPGITSSPPTGVVVGSTYSYIFDVSSPWDSEDTFSYQLITKPDGMIINNNIIRWTPSSNQAGEHSVSILVRSQTYNTFISQDFRITVSSTVVSGDDRSNQPPVTENHAPVLASIDAQTTTVKQSLSFTVEATDPDPGDILTYSVNGLPQGALFPQTRLFSWTPQTVGIYTVTFSVSDGEATDSKTIIITVNPEQPTIRSVNPTLTITSPVATGLYQTDQSTLIVSGTARAGNNDKVKVKMIYNGREQHNQVSNYNSNYLTFSKQISLIQGTKELKIVAQNNEGNLETVKIINIEYDPELQTRCTQSKVGQTRIEFGVTLGCKCDNGCHWEEVLQESTQPAGEPPIVNKPQNSAPVFTKIGEIDVQNQEVSLTTQTRNNLNFKVEATDADADLLTYTMVMVSPQSATLLQGMSFNSQTKVFSWTPALNQVGDYVIQFTVRDGKEGYDTVSVNIGVNSDINIRQTTGDIRGICGAESSGNMFTSTGGKSWRCDNVNGVWGWVDITSEDVEESSSASTAPPVAIAMIPEGIREPSDRKSGYRCYDWEAGLNDCSQDNKILECKYFEGYNYYWNVKEDCGVLNKKCNRDGDLIYCEEVSTKSKAENSEAELAAEPIVRTEWCWNCGRVSNALYTFHYPTRVKVYRSDIQQFADENLISVSFVASKMSEVTMCSDCTLGSDVSIGCRRCQDDVILQGWKNLNA